jgi:MATE family multidrug resistance protein
MQFQNLMAFALDGIAHAAEALVGRSVGANDRTSLVTSVRLSLKWSMVFAVLFSAAYFAGGPALIGLMTDLPEIRSLAIEYLPWMILSPVISVWSFVYDGVFVGATRSKEMRDVMVISTVCVFLPAWWLLLGFGNHGLWAAFLLLQLSRGVGMHLLYQSRVLPLVRDPL